MMSLGGEQPDEKWGFAGNALPDAIISMLMFICNFNTVLDGTCKNHTFSFLAIDWFY